MNGKVIRINEGCYQAIKDIQEGIKKKNINVSETEASRILGEIYFRLKKDTKRPKIIWDFP
jgi:TusA-related sulfurtransferase